MEKIQKFRKALASINLIIISAVFITCAVYTVNVLAEEEFNGPVLVYDGFPFTEPGSANGAGNLLFAPGYYYTTNAAIVESRGTGALFAELLIPEIYLTRDKNNNPLPVPQLAPSGYVTIDVEVLTVSAIDGTPLNIGYVNTIEGWQKNYGNPGYIRHYTIPDKGDPAKLRHFFEIDKADVTQKKDSSGNPELDINGNPVYERTPVRLTLKLTIDMKTRAAEMTNEWNNARMENFGFKVAPAGQEQAILDTFGLTKAEWNSRDFSKIRSFSIMPN